MAYIEELGDSIISSNVRFNEPWVVYNQRKAHRKETSIYWITLRPVYCTASDTVYNPKALVIAYLN